MRAWTEDFEPERESALGAVEAYLRSLPPGLRAQGVLLRTDLIAAESGTADLTGVFARPASYPALHLPCWFGEGDLIKGTFDPDELIRGAFYIAAAAHLTMKIQDPASLSERDAVHLVGALRERARTRLAPYLRAVPALAERYEHAWQDFSESERTARAAYLEGSIIEPDGILRLGAGLWAPHIQPALAAAAASGLPHALDDLAEILMEMNAVFQVVRDVSNLRRDLDAGRVSGLLRRTMALAGIPEFRVEHRERILGALLLSGAAGEMAASARSLLDSCRSKVAALDLAAFSRYLAHLDRALEDAGALLSPGASAGGGGRAAQDGGGGTAGGETREAADSASGDPLRTGGREAPASGRGAAPQRSGDGAVGRGGDRSTAGGGGGAVGGIRIDPAPDTEKVCLASAQAFLLSDRTFKESWEIHRYGLLGADEVISRFPAGLVLEILCQAGVPVLGEVEAFIAAMQGSGYSYFDHPKITVRDTDTLGLVLRLSRCAGDLGPAVRDGLDAMLELLEKSVGDSGRIPVWLDGREADRSGLRLVGEGCGVVEAHLLLGLLAYDGRRFEGLVRRGAGQLLQRFARRGAGITVNYPPLYALYAVGRLLAALDEAGIEVMDRAAMGDAYRETLGAELSLPALTAQEAALAILAGGFEAAGDLARPGLAEHIRKRQLPDGSWPAEPFCFVANRGNAAGWYMSRTMTTALCFRALHAVRDGSGG